MFENFLFVCFMRMDFVH